MFLVWLISPLDFCLNIGLRWMISYQPNNPDITCWEIFTEAKCWMIKRAPRIVFVLDSRSISVDLDGVDAVLRESTALQEGTVIADLHALTGEVTALKQLDAVVLSMLSDRETQVKLALFDLQRPHQEWQQEQWKSFKSQSDGGARGNIRGVH